MLWYALLDRLTLRLTVPYAHHSTRLAPLDPHLPSSVCSSWTQPAILSWAALIGHLIKCHTCHCMEFTRLHRSNHFKASCLCTMYGRPGRNDTQLITCLSCQHMELNWRWYFEDVYTCSKCNDLDSLGSHRNAFLKLFHPLKKHFTHIYSTAVPFWLPLPGGAATQTHSHPTTTHPKILLTGLSRHAKLILQPTHTITRTNAVGTHMERKDLLPTKSVLSEWPYD